MKDVELVLRFICFYKRIYINYNPPSKAWMNDFMRENRNIDEIDEKKIREAFMRAVTNAKTLFGNHAFKRYYASNFEKQQQGWNDKAVVVSLFEVTMDSMARMDTTVLMRHLDALREAIIDLMSTNEKFINSISRASADKVAVNTRFQIWNEVVEKIIKDDKAETRCFSFALKKQLYEQNPTCSICGQHISTIDDCAIDHIDQYWMGGRTIPSNARLAHRFCNCSRSKYDKD